MSGFSCHPLDPELAATVYPLVREAVPGIDLKGWLRFAKRVGNPKRSPRGGIIVVTRKPRSLACGLFVYHTEDDLECGLTLVAEHFIAVDVLDPEPVMGALVAELDALAARLGCVAIRAMVLSQSSLLAEGLHAAGHRPEGATLFKVVGQPGKACDRHDC